MDFETQLKLERTVVVIIFVGSIILGFVLGHMEIATWTH
jgi:hypothetical protein